METEREFTFSEAEYAKLIAEQREERMKQLRRHKLPQELNLREALNALTKTELEDIQYNLNLPIAKNLNRVKKDEMIETIAPEIINFCGRWFVSAVQDQKDLFDFMAQQKEPVADLANEDYQLDYLQGVGVLFCGLQKGKLAWYMPEEIKAEYAKLQNGAFNDAVNLNTEVMRLACGMVFYYGIIDYDTLYKKVCDYIDDELDFSDFMGIVFNIGCWYPHIVNQEHDLMHDDVMNPEKLQQEIRARATIEYKDFPYDKLYEAGQQNYIDSTPAYRALAQYFMKKYNLDVLQAAETVHGITTIYQNGYGVHDIINMLNESKLTLDSVEAVNEFMGMLSRYLNNLPQWILKGHTSKEISQQPKVQPVRKGHKIGRNEPCPCGSGKKYKHCCGRNA